jgi:large subunit ribosomal protein L29
VSKKLEKDKKWKWPAEKMREWTDDELRQREREFSEQLFRLKFQLTGGQSENLQTIRDLRKGMARVKTLLRERDLKTAMETRN